MTDTSTRAPVVLEPASQAFAEATAMPPFLYQLTPTEARKVLDDVQAAPIGKLPVEDRWVTVPYPVALEQGYATAEWIVREGATNGLDPERIAVAGDSVGRPRPRKE